MDPRVSSQKTKGMSCPIPQPSFEKMNLFTQETVHPLQTDTINNIYELPIIGRAVWYLHASTGFPTKATWIKSIRKGNYLSWPLITVSKMWARIYLSLKKRRKGTCVINDKGYGPPKSAKQNRLTTIKEKWKKRNRIFSSPYMTPRAQCTPTRQRNYQLG